MSDNPKNPDFSETLNTILDQAGTTSWRDLGGPWLNLNHVMIGAVDSVDKYIPHVDPGSVLQNVISVTNNTVKDTWDVAVKNASELLSPSATPSVARNDGKKDGKDVA